jgi:hypothetical protein
VTDLFTGRGDEDEITGAGISTTGMNKNKENIRREAVWTLLDDSVFPGN